MSRDSVNAQKGFKDRYALPFPLLSDPDGRVCRAYGVIKEKTLYGKKVKGIERTTVIIDGKGRVVNIFRGVKVDGHVAEVLECL